MEGDSNLPGAECKDRKAASRDTSVKGYGPQRSSSDQKVLRWSFEIRSSAFFRTSPFGFRVSTSALD